MMNEAREKTNVAMEIPEERSRLNDRQRKFLENLLLKGMGQADAYIEAGYQCRTRQYAHESASALLRKLETEREYIALIEKIEQGSRATLKAQIRASIQRLVDLRDHAKGEGVQLKAAQDLLDRAGMGMTQKHEIEEKRKILVVKRKIKADDGGPDAD